MEEEYRTFNAYIGKSGKSLIITISKAVCSVLYLTEENIVQVKIKKEQTKKHK